MSKKVLYEISDISYRLVGKYSAMSGLKKSEFIDELISKFSNQLFLLKDGNSLDLDIDDIFHEKMNNPNYD